MLTRKQTEILAKLAALTKSEPQYVYELKRRLGWKKANGYTVLAALEKAGFIVRKHHNRVRVELTVTGKGHEYLRGLEGRALLAPDRGERFKPVKQDRGILGKKAEPPQEIIGRAERVHLYGSARYENFKGREIVDNARVSRPPALTGYSGENV